MNKFITKVAKLVLGLSLAAGVGVAVGGNAKKAESVSGVSYAWQKMTATSEFVDGAVLLITQGDYYLNVSATSTSQTPRLASLTLSNGLPTLTANNTECFVVSGSGSSIKLCKATDTSNWLITGSSNNAARINTGTTGHYWTISSAGDGKFYLNSNSGTRYLSRYGTTDFRSYTNTNTNADLTIYKLIESGSDPVSVTGVSLNKNTLSIDVGDSETLTATVTPNDATNKAVTWKSYSDSACTTESSAVASVTSGGVVTGESAGTAYIQVKTTDGNFTAKCTVTVTTPSYSNTTGYEDGGVYAIYDGSAYLRAVDTSTQPERVNAIGSATPFTITLVGNNTFTFINSNKYLYATASNNGVRFGNTSDSWLLTAVSGGFTFQDTNNSRYLSSTPTNTGTFANGDWRCYTGTGTGTTALTLVSVSTDPEITEVSLTGSPAANASIGGGNHWGMTATVTAVNDDGESLSRNVNWTVSPAGAVTFSKNPSASGEEITVTAVNSANNNVVITASSAATGFTSVHADSNSFNIVKSYNVSSVTLSATTAGGPTYDANGASSFVVAFTTAVNYSGDAGASKVNISVSPNSGVSGYGDNVTAGNFNLTFTKSGTYTVTSTSVENNEKTANVSITINNIVVLGYEKATSTGDLRNNAKVVIGSTAKTVLMSNAAASAAIGHTSYTVSDTFIPENDLPNDAVELTLHTSGSYWELTALISSTTYYLEYDESKQSSGNSASYASASSTLTKWEISFNNGDVNLVPSTAESRSLRCNTSNSNFACYAGTQSAIQMYVKVDNSPYFSINETTMYLGPRGTSELTLTAHNGASDSITWASSDTDVATVSPSSGLSTTVTGVDEGDTTITATFASGNFETMVVTIHVIPLDTYVNIGVTTFSKVSSTPAGGWAGTYLLVDETAEEIFDGSASPLSADSTKSVTITSGTISATSSMIASSFNIKASTYGYTLRSNSNYYVGNRSVVNGISTSVGVEYEVSIGSDGTITALLEEDGTSSGTTLRHNAAQGSNIWRFYTGSTGNDVALYKADGEMRAISSTLTAFYDAVKANEYLVCHASGSGSSIDFDGIVDETGDLTSQDYDTLKRMAGKSAEDNGNYLEDFISDYDYLVQYKGADDIFGRFDEGGAMYGASRIVPNTLFNVVIKENTNTVAIIVIISLVSVTAIGGYFFFKKKEIQ